MPTLLLCFLCFAVGAAAMYAFLRYRRGFAPDLRPLPPNTPVDKLRDAYWDAQELKRVLNGRALEIKARLRNRTRSASDVLSGSGVA